MVSHGDMAENRGGVHQGCIILPVANVRIRSRGQQLGQLREIAIKGGTAKGLVRFAVLGCRDDGA